MAAVAAATLAAAGAARAAPTVIDFESFGAPATSLTEAGVTFTSDFPTGLVTPVTGPNGTRTIIGHVLDDANDPDYFYFFPMRADFSSLMGSVKVDLGDFPGADQDPDLLFLEIFDASDVSLGRVELAIGPQEPLMRTLSVSAASRDIRYAVFGAAGDGLSSVYADNFTFDTAVPEPAAWALMIAGFGIAGSALRRRGRALAG
jgi:hypothetical protein